MRSHSNDILTSPYVIGTSLGLLNAFAFATAKRGLGVTSAFESGAALTERRLAPDATRINEYVRQREEVPKIDWESLLVLGVYAGSYLSARTASERTASVMSRAWSRRFGPSRLKRYAAAFLGGAIMMFGARMAKGCTSGHALTGVSQLALSSWVFTPLMFGSAALVARLLYGKDGR